MRFGEACHTCIIPTHNWPTSAVFSNHKFSLQITCQRLITHVQQYDNTHSPPVTQAIGKLTYTCPD